jgi:hypothetical protein
MNRSKIHLKYEASSQGSAFKQGELLSNVIQTRCIDFLYDESNEIKSSSTELLMHPFCVVLTQSCDLEGDFIVKHNNDIREISLKLQTNIEDGQQLSLSRRKELEKKLADLEGKYLNSIILCEVDTAENVKNNNSRKAMSSEAWNRVKINRDERFHFLQAVPTECDHEKIGLPELTVDFKRIFSLDSDFLYYQVDQRIAGRRTTLVSPYLEHFAHRYSTYIGQVALPEPYLSA